VQIDDQTDIGPDHNLETSTTKDHLGEWIDGNLVDLETNDGTPTWLPHPKGQEIDVAVVPIDAFPQECTVYQLPRPNETTDMAFCIGMDAYILGFPKSISHQKFLPIWKRASVATEPDIPHDNSEIVADKPSNPSRIASPTFSTLSALSGHAADVGECPVWMAPALQGFFEVST